MLHGLCVGEEAGARNLVFFRVKWLQAAMKGTLCVRRVRAGLPRSSQCKCWFLRVSVLSSYMVLWKPRLQNAL